jgi:tRNA1Val (adenine37-N6)-methyltransferase
LCAVTTATTTGHLLDGRVRYAQPREGFRSGIEPVLLAAAVPAGADEHVLEGGSGAGAALLCLAARVPGVRGVGVERDPSLAALATGNAAANAAAGLRFVTGDLLATPPVYRHPRGSGDPGALGSRLSEEDDERFDHAFANPPYHPTDGTASPLPARDAAKRGGPGLLHRWAAALAAPLRPWGTLTLILPGASLPEALAAMHDAGCRPAALLPLWPKAGRTAKLVLLQGSKGGRAPLRLLPGLVLHEAGGGFTAAADAILRGGGALAL